MAETITISKKKFEELSKKAEAFEKIVENEVLSVYDLIKISKAKKTRLLSEKEFFS